MNIAIQGHPTRGKEVIQILESLGGKNTNHLHGDNYDGYYCILGDNQIICVFSILGHKVYTLEEFEKEFPFKIGDIILLKGINNPYEVIALEEYMNKLCYKLDNGLHYAPDTLITYEKMKEERNITLTFKKAQEWYKKGGELKEVALQAFSEKELNPLPRSWEEFCENYPIQDHEAFINYANGDITICKECAGSGLGVWKRKPEKDRCKCVSQKSAEAHLALIQLEQLRDCWLNGWEPIWDCSEKWCIRLWGNELGVGVATHTARFLTFPTNEMAREFLECFRDLIEKAKDLI